MLQKREAIDVAMARLRQGPVYIPNAIMYGDPTLYGAHYYWLDEARHNQDLARRIGSALWIMAANNQITA